jgi:acyl CoA:acetate/3-ketoacid CoA transferase
LETGKPRDLSIKQGSALGDWKVRGTARFGHETMDSGIFQEKWGRLEEIIKGK